MYDTINIFNRLGIYSWGELNNKEEISRICPNIVEAQKEEWRDCEAFFNDCVGNCRSKYYLLIDDSAEIIIPQIYFIRCLSILEGNPVVSFIYCDYNKILLPSFRPLVFDNLEFANPPIVVRNLKDKFKLNETNGYYLNNLLKVLSRHVIGYHIAEPLIKVKDESTS